MARKNTNKENRSLEEAAILSEALPYMRRHANETFVIKYGGHAMGDQALSDLFAKDIVLLNHVGINTIIVHGGGPQIAEMLERLKIKSTFVDGLRVTDADTVQIVEMVLAGNINKQVATSINQAGGLAVGLSGKDGNLILAKKIHRSKQDPGSNIENILDLGFVGEPEEISRELLDVFQETDIIPVIAPIGTGTNGETLNINADTAAGSIASSMGASRLLLLTDVEGVLDDNGKLIKKMGLKKAKKLIQNGTIKDGMIPKVETCLKAVEEGVEAAVIIDGRTPHALLLELFTEHGAGTLIESN